MPVLIDAIDVKRRTRFEMDNTPSPASKSR